MPLSRIILTRTLGFLIPEGRNRAEQSSLQIMTKKSVDGVREGGKTRVNLEFSKGEPISEECPPAPQRLLKQNSAEV